MSPGFSGQWISPSSVQHNLGLLERAELSELRRLGSIRYVEQGTVVAAAGSVATQVQVVGDGELELMARLDAGRATLAVVRTGGVIQDIPVLLGQTMPFDAIATRETEMVALTLEAWTKLLDSSPSLSMRWMASIARRLNDERRRLVVITSKPLIAQVAYLLLDLAEINETGQCVVRLSHTTMAQLLGARRQSLSRVFAELRSRGLVGSRYGVTVLFDERGLRKVMGSPPLP
jgi:CRP-like cAMP-binding protein